MLIIVIFFLMEKKSLNLKLTIKMLTSQFNFVSEVYLMNLGIQSLGKYRSIKMLWFSVHYNSIDKSDVLKIHKYLMRKNNIKYYPHKLYMCLLCY